MTDPFRSWADRYNEELDKTSPLRGLVGQRARLLLAHRGARKRGVSRPAYWTFAGAGALLVLLAFFVFNQGGTASSNEEYPRLAGSSINVGQAIFAQHAAQELTFPRGSRVTWSENSQGSLAKYSADTVELQIDSGKVEFDVTHRAGRTWLIHAGKFRVYVVGTAFTVDYDQFSGAVDVRVVRGRVRVEGSRVEQGGIVLDPGQRFSWQPELRETAPPVREETSAAELPVDPRAETKPSNQGQKPVRLEKSAKTSWQNLARQGKYNLALDEVERLGSGAVIEKASPDDKLLLGNAARYSGRTELARRAYTQVRATPGPAATLAAYYLAKGELDSGGNAQEAIRWLRIYLKEGPQGELASSARGRLMILLETAGDHAGAVSVARQYLNLHPGGPHLQTAKSLAGTP